MSKKYMSLERLQEYDALIKQEISDAVSGKANSSHTHDDRYYTESEIDSKISSVNTSISNITSGTTVVKNAEHAESADSATTAGSATTATTATKLGSSSVGSSSQPIYLNSGTATKITAVGTAYGGTGATTVADARTNLDVYSKSEVDSSLSGKASSTHNHDSAYDKKGAADTALASANTYTDGKISALLDGADDTTLDSIKELANAIKTNDSAIDALNDIASGKADASHSHAIADVTGLQSALDGKAASSHGTHVTFDSTNKPKMDGTAAFGTSTNVARADHVHPTDTSRAAKSDFDTHVADTTKHITSTERTNWNAAKTHADSAHAPSNAQANVIESIKVNGTAQTITSKAVNITVPTKASDIGAAAATHSHAISDITNLQTTLNNASSAIGANTSSITALTDRTSALETKVGDGFSEITSAEIQALFA